MCLCFLCNPVIYCLVEVSASQSSRKCSMSTVVFALHISQFVYPSVCLLSMLSFMVPLLALNKVVVVVPSPLCATTSMYDSTFV